MKRDVMLTTSILVSIVIVCLTIISVKLEASAHIFANTKAESKESDEHIEKVLQILNRPITGSTQDEPIEEKQEELPKNVMEQIEAMNDVIEEMEKEFAFYAPVSVSYNQRIIGGEGTEIILRSGEACGYSEEEEGLLDVTKGIEIRHNQQVEKGHVLIVPRDDGRGIKVTGEEEAWFLIRGPYQIDDTDNEVKTEN